MNTSDKEPAFSIVIAVQNQADELAANLPSFLSQQYGRFEVIVIDESSNDGSADILKQMKSESQHLYSTFLPKYHFQKNRRRLAFSIGVKASKNDWIVFTDITTPPLSDQWLTELESFTTKNIDLILGYFNRKKDTIVLKSYEEISEASRLISKAERWRMNVGHDRWLRYIKRSSRYDFIAVRSNHGHELLRLFAYDTHNQPSKE